MSNNKAQRKLQTRLRNKQFPGATQPPFQQFWDGACSFASAASAAFANAKEINRKNALAFLGKPPAVQDLVFFELANDGKDGRLAALVKYPFFACGYKDILAENSHHAKSNMLIELL